MEKTNSTNYIINLKNDTKKAYLLFIGAMFIFGSMGVLVKFIPLSGAMIAFFRGIIASIFTVIYAKCKKIKVFEKMSVTTFFLIVLNGIAIGVNWVLLFSAYKYTSVSVATLCYYMQPIFVILASPLFFKERLTKYKISCAFIAIFGMILVSGVLNRKGMEITEYIGIILALIGGAVYAFAVILNKKVCLDNFYERSAIQLFVASICLLPYLLIRKEFVDFTIDLKGIILLLILGIVHTGIAYIMFFNSISYLKAQSIAILSYFDPVFAVILSTLILGETMTWQVFSGAVMIIGAAICSEVDIINIVSSKNK